MRELEKEDLSTKRNYKFIYFLYRKKINESALNTKMWAGRKERDRETD